MRNDPFARRDRVLAAIEIPALGIWTGALLGFAFVSAPIAFRLFSPVDITRFAALTAQSLSVLTVWGYVLGGIAIVCAVLRAAMAGDRTADFVRVLLVAIALGLATYEQRAIVPAMTATPDVRGAAYQALHQRSSEVYGGVVLLALVALVLAAVRRDD
ncbi:MAG TPA: DUF4149 domain-containing protein [Candidatus Elarobacter sp.]|jgi:hypothetical protein|nr:DUF4149 domain-containing protein [Candidatus Elarobacter sp.]